MVSRGVLACLALACIICCAAADSGASRRLLGPKAKQAGVNVAAGSKQVNQANANQLAVAKGYLSAAYNAAGIKQSNSNPGSGTYSGPALINAASQKVPGADQSGLNVASGSGQVNQANVNQNAQAKSGGTAANIAGVDQSNKNGAKGSAQVNQANVNQNAQASNGGTAANEVYITQQNKDAAKGQLQANQANANQNAQANGDSTAGTSGSIDTSNKGTSVSSNAAATANNGGSSKASSDLSGSSGR